MLRVRSLASHCARGCVRFASAGKTGDERGGVAVRRLADSSGEVGTAAQKKTSFEKPPTNDSAGDGGPKPAVKTGLVVAGDALERGMQGTVDNHMGLWETNVRRCRSYVLRAAAGGRSIRVTTEITACLALLVIGCVVLVFCFIIQYSDNTRSGPIITTSGVQLY